MMLTWRQLIDPAGTVLSLTLIDRRYAEPGAAVTVVWGEHPGPGTAPDAEPGSPGPTVQPAPPDQHARVPYARTPEARTPESRGGPRRPGGQGVGFVFA